MKKKRKLLTSLKRAITGILCGAVIATSTFSSYSITTYAANTSATSKLDQFANRTWINAIRNGSYSLGATIGGAAGGAAGGAIGSVVAPGAGTVAGAGAGTAAGTIVGSALIGGAVNGFLDVFADPTDVGTYTPNSGGAINYKVYSGKSTSYNNTTYNNTKKQTFYNEYKTENNYKYEWYNPITNNYDITNEYHYNQTYNTFNYTTYNVTNNYTTNYYIQDNRTYVSYYIVNENKDSGEKEETYLEIYYKLPDGRSSYDLKASDIKGTYFPSKYSKYVSNAEDDKKTLGLWHLDGDLKDSSYWNNTPGSSYSNKFTDGLYTSGKIFSEDMNDFLELKLDKVSLPSSWTLEWCEYIPEIKIETPSYPVSDYYYNNLKNLSYSSTGKDQFGGTTYLHGDPSQDSHYNIYLRGYLGIDDDSLYLSSAGSFVPYAIVCSGGSYKFYRNGVLQSVSSIDDFSFKYYADKTSSSSWTQTQTGSFINKFKGISVTNSSIKFYEPDEPVCYVRSSSWLESSSYYHFNHARFNYYLLPHVNSIIDEVRLSKGALYTGSSYTPSMQPFTTNTVLTVPENPEKHEISFKTNTKLGNVRFGGARQTYPTNGSIYVSLSDKQIVDSVQQYQNDGWYEIEGAVYFNNYWTPLKGFDLSMLSIKDNVSSDSKEEPDKEPTVSDCTLRVENTSTGILCTPSHSSTCSSSTVFIDDTEYSFGVTGTYLHTDAVDGQTYKIHMKCIHNKDGKEIIRTGQTTSWTYHATGDSGGVQPSPPEDSGGGSSSGLGIFDSIGNLLKTIVTAISKIVAPLLDGISELLGSIIDGLVNITSFGTKFGEFLSGAFTFIPDEIITVLTLGVSLAILAIIFRILKR